MQEVKVLYSEGIATHADPQSCAWFRKEPGEALTWGVRAGLLSREITEEPRCPHCYQKWGRNQLPRYRELQPDLARSKNPCAYTSILHGNREIP